MTTTRYKLVDPDAIQKLKLFQKILNSLLIDNQDTNVNSFITTALTLEKYVSWNDYYNSEDDYSTKAIEYLNQGAPYRNTAWSVAVTYYEKAYTVANNGYNHFKNSNENGMQEAARWYKAFKEQIRRTINKESTTAPQESEYNSASAAYKQMIVEYMDVLSEVSNILKQFPQKLY